MADRWKPTFAIHASLALHVAAVIAVIARPHLWPWVLAVIFVDHMILTAAGLWPRSKLLGPNWTHLPIPAAAHGSVAITIDDGPDPAVTPRVLDLLDRHSAKATFFCIGELVERHSLLAQEIVRRGHSIENHSQHHLHRFSVMSPGGMRAEVARAQDAIEAVTGQRPRFFRAPAGLRSPFLEPVLTRLGLRLVSWTRRGFDTVNPDPEVVYRRLTEGLKSGDILLLHDGHAAHTPTGSPVILGGVATNAGGDCRCRAHSRHPAVSAHVRAHATTAALVKAASASYWKTDLFGYFRARGKLRGDPAFAGILSEGLLAGAQRILDLGCGQGLLAAWLDAAQRRFEERPHLWPKEWQAPPRPLSFRGIELQRRDVRRARVALGSRAEFEVGDIAEADFGSVDSVVILDVIHYLDYQTQLRVLERACAALSPDGILLLRVSDAGSGIRHTVGKYIDLTVMVIHYRRAPKVYCRPIPEWESVLSSVGFRSELMPMSAGTPFANTMLIARPHKKARLARTLTDSLITQ